MRRCIAFVLMVASVIWFGSTLVLQQHEVLVQGEASQCLHPLHGDDAYPDEAAPGEDDVTGVTGTPVDLAWP